VPGLFLKRLSQSNPEHSLLAVAIALGPFRDHRDYSLGLAILWLSVHLLRQLWSSRHHWTGHIASLTPGIALGLLLIQSRMLIRMDDNDGPTRYLLIAVALLVGSGLSRTSWKHLLQWIATGTLALSIIFWLQSDISNSNWLAEANKYWAGEGYGGINMLGSALNVLTVFSFYCLRSSNNWLPRLISFTGCLLSFMLCLASNSRMAAVAPLLAIFFAWLISKGWAQAQRLSKLPKVAAVGLSILIPSATYWYFAIRPDLKIGMVNDTARLEIWWCNLQNSIFAGNNKIVYGSGYDWTAIRDACGHASSHNAYIQFLSMHGLLGFIAFAMLLIFVTKGIQNHLIQRNREQGFWHCSWGETALGTTLVVLFAAISSSTHLGGYLNPLLIGLAFSMSLITLPTSTSSTTSVR